MNQPSSTYRDRLQGELVEASRRLHLQHQDAQAAPPPQRLQQRHARFVLGGTLGIALAAGIAVLLIGLGAGAQRPSAQWSRWTAAPTQPAEGQTAAAEEACLAQAASTPRFHRERPAEAWTVQVAETRGPFTLVLLESSGQSELLSCLATSTQAQVTAGAGGPADGAQPTVAAEQIRPIFAGGATFPPNTHPPTPSELEHQYSFISGLVGDGVSAVTLILQDGERVTPTIAKGWFLAWWPTRERVISVEVRTAQGTNSEPFSGTLGGETAPVTGG